MARQFTAFRIDEELLDGLRRLEERDGTPRSSAVRRAIRDFLKKRGISVNAERQRASTRRRS